MDIKQLAETARDKAGAYLSDGVERVILLQSAGLAVAVMVASYAYGITNYTPEGSRCPPIVPGSYMRFDPSLCTPVPEVVVYPSPWLSMLLYGIAATVILAVVAVALHRSVFVRYLFAGWFGFCAAIALFGYLSYAGMGRFFGAYFVAYPATTIVALGVAAACVAAAVNIVTRLKGVPA